MSGETPERSEPQIYSRKDFCTTHNIGPTKFHALVKEGEIEVVKIGAKTGVTRDAARRFRESLHRVNPANA